MFYSFTFWVVGRDVDPTGEDAKARDSGGWEAGSLIIININQGPAASAGIFIA